jgi:hypothetical protein
MSWRKNRPMYVNVAQHISCRNQCIAVVKSTPKNEGYFCKFPETAQCMFEKSHPICENKPNLVTLDGTTPRVVPILETRLCPGGVI